MADTVVVVLQQSLKPIKLVKWKVNEGNSVSNGCVFLLYEVDGDDKHVVCKLKSSQAGTVYKLLAQEGDVVKPGDRLLELQACTHPTVMRDMCAECGADLRKDDITAVASVPMVHSVPELKVSLEQAKKIGQADVDRLLKDRKLVLLVDLDQTLIHTTNDNIPANIKDVYHFQLYGVHSPWYHTRLRPGTHQFLANMSPYFELHICTFGARNYAHMIAMFLDQDGKLFSQRILSRDECFNPTSKTANLKALFPCGDNLVCIIDDREDVWSHAANLIHVKPYHFFQHTGDINAPPGLDKHENDEKEGVDLTKVKNDKSKKVKINGSVEETVETTNGDDKSNNADEDDKMCPEESKISTTLEENNDEEHKRSKNYEEPKNLYNEELKESKSQAIEDKNEEKIEEASKNLKTSEENAVEKMHEENETLDINKEKDDDKTEEKISKKEDKDTNNVNSENESNNEESNSEKLKHNSKEIDKNITDEPIVENKSTNSDTIITESNTIDTHSTDEAKSIDTLNTNIVESKTIDCKSEKTDDVDKNVTENSVDKTPESNIIDKEVNEEKSTEEKENTAPKEDENNLQNNEVQNKTETYSNSHIDNETKEELIEIEDPDDYLLYLEDILKTIHKAFYDKYDKLEAGNVPDLKKVIPEVKGNVLKDAKLVFSGLVPTHIKLEQSKAYQVARSLGATVTQDLEGDTTHLVAVRPGTAKVNAGRRKKNLKIVTPDWLWACAERWAKLEEKLYPLNNKGSKNRHPPPHCSSPEHNSNSKEVGEPCARKRTPSGRFMDTINPLMSFSSADIADMDREVEDIFNESESDGETSNKRPVEVDNDVALLQELNRVKDSDEESSSSAESLTADHPSNWGPNRRAKKRLRDDQDDLDDESTADEYPSTKFRRGEQLSSDLDIGQDSNSEGSADAPDEIDDGDWNMMGAALEREFLSNN